MDKPTKPTTLMPRSFGGIKNNWSVSMQTTGYEDGVPVIYGGDNLNYQLDATGKELDYCETICDFINALPIGKSLITDVNNKLIYTQYGIRVYNSAEIYGLNDVVMAIVSDEVKLFKSLIANNTGNALTDTTKWEKVEMGGGASRNVGEIVASAIPLTDAGLHLLDGALISGGGAYGAFVDYIADLYDSGDYPDLFETEANWQQSVTTYGVCGKFVYDSINDTVRLPKVTGFIEGASGIATLGDVTAAGLPQHTHSGTTNSSGSHYHTVGGSDDNSSTPRDGFDLQSDELFYKQVIINTSSAGEHTHTFSTGNASNSVYGASNTVQPQSVQVLYYIVVATSTKIEIEVDIDEIATDLNGKADKDLSNLDTYGNNRLHALKGYLDEGELLTDGEGLADLTQMAYSTFDSSKFTVVGSPTINNGVVTNFSSSDYVKGNFELGNLLDKSWKIETRFWYDKDAESATGAHGPIVLFGNSWRSQAGYMGTADFYKLKMWVATKNNDNNSENIWYYIPNKVIAASGYVYESLSFDYTTGTYTMYFEFPDGTTDTKLYTPTTNNKQMYNVVLNPTQTLQFGYGQTDGLAHSPIDLKHVNVYVEGVKVFSGNITGSHTYTIGGSTVTIPYTLSKTGSMIVDSAYRTQVAALYAQEGNAPYFTLQEGVNFTLPQGEPYGMIQNAYANVLPDYANGITMGLPYTPTTTKSTFTAPSAGWAYIHGVRQGGTGGTLRVYVNNAPVAIFVGYSSFGSSAIFPVSKNDIISVDVDINSTWTINDQYFYPSKGV